jgi:hypothetical protein
MPQIHERNIHIPRTCTVGWPKCKVVTFSLQMWWMPSTTVRKEVIEGSLVDAVSSIRYAPSFVFAVSTPKKGGWNLPLLVGSFLLTARICASPMASCLPWRDQSRQAISIYCSQVWNFQELKDPKRFNALSKGFSPYPRTRWNHREFSPSLRHPVYTVPAALWAHRNSATHPTW